MVGRKLIAVVLAVFLLSACHTPIVEEDETAVPIQQQKSTVILVDEALEPEFIQAAQRFCDEINRLTNGDIYVEVAVSKNATAVYSIGNAAFAFLDSKESARMNSSFQAVSQPFLYVDYERFTMAVNSTAIIELVADGFVRLSSVPLAAYYRPSNHFVSTWQPRWQPEEGLTFEAATVAITPSSSSGSGFEMLGASVIVEPDPVLRMTDLFDGSIQGAEFTLEQLSALDWQAGGVNLYLTLSYHTVSPVWLVANQTFYNSLTSQQQAALTEVAAYLYSSLDDVYIKREEELVQGFYSQGMLWNPDSFSSIRDAIYIPLEDAEESDQEVPWLDYVWGIVSALE